MSTVEIVPYSQRRNPIRKAKRTIHREYRKLRKLTCLMVESYSRLQQALEELREHTEPKELERYVDNKMPFHLSAIRHIKELLSTCTPKGGAGEVIEIVPIIIVSEGKLYFQLTHDGVEPITVAKPSTPTVPDVIGELYHNPMPGKYYVVSECLEAVYDVAQRIYDIYVSRPGHNINQDKDKIFKQILSVIWTASSFLAQHIEDHANIRIRKANKEFQRAMKVIKRGKVP